jgi:hypothetical protein
MDKEKENSIETLINCPKDECCGCLVIIYSAERQQVETKCNECNRLSVIMNSEGKLVC